MVYLLIFYWIFAALFVFGAINEESEIKGAIGLLIASIILGGILFPIYLGRLISIFKR